MAKKAKEATAVKGKEKEKEVASKPKSAAVTRKDYDALAAHVRKLTNIMETKFGFDIDRDGVVGGFARVGVLALLAGLLLAGPVMAVEVFRIWSSDTTYGTFVVESDLAGTATLTVDAITSTTTSYGNSVTFAAGAVLAQDQDLTVATDNTSDLGTSSAEFKDAYFDGTVHMDVLDVDETATLVGVATFTAQPVLNGGIDINEDIDVDFDATDEELNLTTSDGGTYVVRLHNSDADVTAQSTLLALTYADDGQANADFITCLDNSGNDAKFTVGNDGNTVIAGTLGVTGAATFTAQSVHSAGINADEDVDIDFDATDEEVNITTSSGGTYVLQVHNSDSDVGSQSTLLALTYTDDGQALGDFITCLDNASGTAKFTVGNDGNTVIAGTLAVTGVATLTGKPVLNGGLDVNEEIDIDLDAADEEIDIKQAAVAGTASTPLINIDDNRTGETANAADEATIYIDAEGSYGIAVVDGIIQVEAEIDTPAGDLLLDPAGSEVHIDGGLDIGGTSAVGDNNLKVGGTAAMVGVATFTAQDIHNGGIDINEDVDIDLDANDEEVVITHATNCNAAAVVEIECTAAAVTNDTTLLELNYTADGSTNAHYIDCNDNAQANSKFRVSTDGNTTVAGTLGVTGVATMTADVSIDGKYAVVGTNATTGFMVQYGTFTNKQPTVTFNVPFASGTTPSVTANWTDDVSGLESATNAAIGITGLASNQFVPKTGIAVDTITNITYIAIGPRP